MNLLNDTKPISVLATAIGLSTVVGLSSMSPAAAAILQIGFCGFFNNDENQGEVDGTITLDTDKIGIENDNWGVLNAEIKTTRGLGDTDLLMYTTEDVAGTGSGSGTMGVTFLVDPSRYFQFENSGNTFLAVIPEEYFENPGTTLETKNFEKRIDDMEFIRDPDKVFQVPEPLTILGSATALGFGAMFKKEHSRRKKTKTKA